MYNIGQADNLLTGRNVAMPKYDNGSLTKQQYSCEYVLPDNSKKPINIPLGEFNDGNNAYDTNGYKENYVEETQQKRAGEPSDKCLLIIMVILLCVLVICTCLSFNN